MSADITKQSLWPTCLLLVGLLALFFWRAWTSPVAAEALLPSDVLLGEWLSGRLAQVPWLTQGLLLLLVVVNALRVTRITTRCMVFVVRSLLPIVFFAIVACGFYMTPHNAIPMVVVWLLISASNYFLASFRRAASFGLLFKGGLLAGVLPLLWPAGVLLWVSVPVSIVLFRRSGREAIVAVVALLLPVALYGYVEWLAGGEFTAAARTIWDYLIAPNGYEPLAMDAARIALSCLVVLLIFVSLGTYLGQIRTMRTRPARIVVYFSWIFAAAVGMLLLPCRNVMAFPVLAIGVAVIAPIYFARYRGTTPAVFYGAILVSAIVVAIQTAIA